MGHDGCLSPTLRCCGGLVACAERNTYLGSRPVSAKFKPSALDSSFCRSPDLLLHTPACLSPHFPALSHDETTRQSCASDSSLLLHALSVLAWLAASPPFSAQMYLRETHKRVGFAFSFLSFDPIVILSTAFITIHRCLLILPNQSPPIASRPSQSQCGVTLDRASVSTLNSHQGKVGVTPRISLDSQDESPTHRGWYWEVGPLEGNQRMMEKASLLGSVSLRKMP